MNVSLLSVLSGAKAEVAMSSPEEASAPTDSNFLSALLEALGMGGECSECDEALDGSDANAAMAEMFSEVSTEAEEEPDGERMPEWGDSGSISSSAASSYGTGGSSGLDPVALGVDTGREAISDAQETPIRVEDTTLVTPLGRPRELDRADPSLDDVHPALREKIERIVERMRDEFGHEVRVVEGYRSPARQAHLYEQGRTRPGDITTWTRRSWHTDGLAADLLVDGSYDNKLAYARLQRIAREEGLRTLGSSDRGHVELPGSRALDGTVSLGPTRRFVGVAVPAAVAARAAVAAVATPGSWVTTEPAATVLPAAPPPIDAPVIAMGDEGATDRSPPRPVEGPVVEELQVSPDPRVAAGSTQDRPPGDGADGAEQVERRDLVAAHNARSNAARPEIATGSVASIDAAGTLERAQRIQELQELARAVRPSRVSLRFGDNGSDQIRVGLLNQLIDADLDIADAESAANIRSRVSELHRALETRGLGLSALSVNGSAASPGGVNGWLGGQPDAAAELIRTLFATPSGEAGQRGYDRERSAPENGTNHGGSGSDRARRDAKKEGDK